MIVLLSMPFYLKLVNYGLSSVRTVNSIIKDSDRSSLSMAEKSAIMVIACVYLYCEQWNVSDIFITWLSDCPNSYFFDLMTCLLNLALFFSVIFLCISLVHTPLSIFALGYTGVFSRIPVKLKNYYIQITQAEDRPARKKFWFTSFFIHLKNVGRPWRYLLYPIVLLVILADFLITILTYFWTIVEAVAIYSMQILGELVKLLNVFMWKVRNISDRQFVAMSFRMATVASIVSIVIINRIDPVFINVENCTAIFEFLASAVVIPVIYAWINTWLVKRKSVDQ